MPELLPRRAWLGAILLLAILPLAVLHPAVFGGMSFLPFDHACFPPESLVFPTDELAARRSGANFDVTEKGLVFLPEIRLAREELAKGRFPSWNPYVRAGAPLFANTVAGYAHPAHLPHLLLDPERGFAITAWIHLALAGLLMLGFLRHLGVGAPAALFGAVAFAWSGALVTKAHFYMMHAPLAWLPGLFWALDCVRKGGGGGAVAATAVATAMIWTAGFPPYAVAVSLLGVWYVVFGSASTVLARKPGAVRTLLCGGGGLLLGLALAGIQVAPMVLFFSQSSLDLAPGRHALAGQGFDRFGWLGFLLPQPFGTPALHQDGILPYEKSPLTWVLFGRAHEGTAQPLFNFTEYAVYLGALPLLAVLAGVRAARSTFHVFALISAVLWMAIASAGPLMHALYAALPPIRSTQPMRFSAPVTFLLAAAAALGFDRLFDPLRAGRVRITLVLALALSVGCLAAAVTLASSGAEARMSALLRALETAWGARFHEIGAEQVRAWFAPVLDPATRVLRANLEHAAVLFGVAALLVLLARRFPRCVASAAILITAAELVLLAIPVTPCSPPAPRGETSVHEFLRRERDRLAPQGGFTVARVRATAPPSGIASTADPSAIVPNTLVPERIRDLNALGFLDGRSHAPFVELYGSSHPTLLIRGLSLGSLPDEDTLDRPLLDLFGVRYLLCAAASGAPPPLHAGGEAMEPLVGPQGSLRVFERSDPCPRAFVVPEVSVVPDDGAAARVLASREWEPRRTLVLTPEEAARLGPVPAGSGGGEVRFELDEASHILLRVKGSGGGYLLLADAFLPGWEARVDGVPAKLARGDLCFRAVPVPRGDSVVEFRYTPPGLLAGAVCSVLALAMCVWLWMRGRRSRRQAESREHRVSP